MALPVMVDLSAVIVAVTAGVPRILSVTPDGRRDGGSTDSSRALESLPWGPLDPEADRTLELGLRRWVREQTGLELGYVEQLYTFGDRDRDPGAAVRVLSISYLALVREGRTSGGGQALWGDCYAYFPWEDWRAGRPEIIDRRIAPALERWSGAAAARAVREARRERAAIAFGLAGAPWDGERVLERYELLYEAILVAEAARDAASGSPGSGEAVGGVGAAAAAGAAGRAGREDAVGAGVRAAGADVPVRLGQPMAADHRRIAATALGRLRGKLRYRPVVFELLPSVFTLLQLQEVVEALAGVRLHKQNFRRLVERGRLVEGTGRLQQRTGGRPAELFQFRREVLHERPAPGVGLPQLRSMGSRRPGGPASSGLAPGS
jgi:hypothetical protein